MVRLYWIPNAIGLIKSLLLLVLFNSFSRRTILTKLFFDYIIMSILFGILIKFNLRVCQEKFGLIHGNGGLGYRQGIAIVERVDA